VSREDGSRTLAASARDPSARPKFEAFRLCFVIDARGCNVEALLTPSRQ
jgi:hypothetical protein